MSQYSQIIKQHDIAALIPHTGAMCLLDEVNFWDSTNIKCVTNSHLNIKNPLRYNNELPVYALIEYGAQAMAVHGGLLAKSSGKTLSEGYLAALRDIRINIESIEFIKSVLVVEAVQKMASGGNMIYSFSISSDNELLLSGRATVVAVLAKQ